MLSRRDFLKWTGFAISSPSFLSTGVKPNGMRCINVVNFIRGVEPRFETDLLLPVQKQMEIIRRLQLPATWLLQFDALVSGDFVPFLKQNLAKDHEVGFWFEMNRMLCDKAGVEWRGRQGYEWDHEPPVAFTIGYTPEERIKLADTAVREFKKIWGKTPKSIACWNLDALTMAHLTKQYGVDAYAVCRDQIATDGFTIWGAPIAGYYPSKTNCWSPAVETANQIDTPVFRMLGQDPVHYYKRRYKMSDGREISTPDTMEPVWPTGRSPHFVKTFLKMIEQDPTLKFGYAQLGQENSFPWASQAAAYPMQMDALAELRADGIVHVETMGDSGRRFKKAFRTTPAQAQVMLDDPFGNTNPAENSIWFQSRFYRANLHIEGGLPFFRDITVYSDEFPQPFLKQATRQNDVEQRMPAVLDGFHWGKARGQLLIDGEPAKLSGKPVVREDGNTLVVVLTFGNGRVVSVQFSETDIAIVASNVGTFSLSFEWDSAKSALRHVEPRRVAYRWEGLDYAVDVLAGKAEARQDGWLATPTKGAIKLRLSQVSQ